MADVDAAIGQQERSVTDADDGEMMVVCIGCHDDWHFAMQARIMTDFDAIKALWEVVVWVFDGVAYFLMVDEQLAINTPRRI